MKNLQSTNLAAHQQQKAKLLNLIFKSTVKLGNKERFDKEQIGIKEPFPITSLPFTSLG